MPRTKAASSEQTPATFAFSALLNMSPTMIMPPCDHCPIPPRSGWLNWACVACPAIIKMLQAEILNLLEMQMNSENMNSNGALDERQGRNLRQKRSRSASR